MWPQLRLSFGNGDDAKWPELNRITLIKIMTLVELFSQKQPAKWKTKKQFFCVGLSDFFSPTSQTSDFASCHMATLQLLVTVAKTVTCFLRLTCQRGEILWRVLSVSVLRPKRFKAWARRGKAMLVSLLTVWLHNRNVFYVVCIGLAARVGTCRTHLMAKHL